MLRRHASENPEYQPARQERYPLHQRSRDRLYQYALPIFHANRRVRMAPPGNGHRRGKRRNDHTTGALYDSRYVQERGYATAAIGKWHLGLGDKAGEQDWNAPLPTALGDLGFDYSYIMAATADRAPAYSSRTGRWRTTIRTPRSMSVTRRTFPESRPEKIIRNYYTTRSPVSGTTNPS